MVDPGIFLSSLLLTQVPEKQTVRKNKQRNHAQRKRELQAQEWRKVQEGRGWSSGFKGGGLEGVVEPRLLKPQMLLVRPAFNHTTCRPG